MEASAPSRAVLAPLPAFGVPLGPRSGGTLRERDPKVTGLFAAFGAYLAWGLLPIYFKALRPLPPLEILSHRVVWSVLLLAAVVAARNGWRELAGALRGWRRLATFSGTTLLIGSNWLTYIWAVNSGQLLQASLGYFVNPLVNVLLGVVLLREPLNRRQAVAVCLAAAGVLWLVLGYGRFPWISLFLAFSFGLYGLVRKVAGIGAVSGLLVETALLAPLALAYLLSRARDGSGAFGSGWRPTLLLLAAGVITAIPLVWFTVGVQRLRLSTMGVLQYLAPSLQFALAVWLYGEPFTRSHIATFGCIWVSLAIYTWDALTARRAGPAVEPLD